MKGFVLSLALRQRRNATRKSPRTNKDSSINQTCYVKYSIHSQLKNNLKTWKWLLSMLKWNLFWLWESSFFSNRLYHKRLISTVRHIGRAFFICFWWINRRRIFCLNGRMIFCLNRQIIFWLNGLHHGPLVCFAPTAEWLASTTTVTSFGWHLQSVFHPSHRLLSRLKNNFAASLTILLGDLVCF